MPWKHMLIAALENPDHWAAAKNPLETCRGRAPAHDISPGHHHRCHRCTRNTPEAAGLVFVPAAQDPDSHSDTAQPLASLFVQGESADTQFPEVQIGSEAL